MATRNYFHLFVEGAREGWRISTHAIIPNVIMAFVLIKILDDTGALKLLSHVFEPITAIFGLPGEAMMVLLTSLLSIGGGTGAAMGLYHSGALTPVHLTILLPAIFLIGGQIQNLGRILGVIGIHPRYYLLLWGVTLMNGAIAMFLMRLWLHV